MDRYGTTAIVAAICLVSVGGLFLQPAMSETSFDGKWQGSYEIVKDYGAFDCEGGEILMEINGTGVDIETRNNRSSWTFRGTIDAGGRLSASGDISTDFSKPDLDKTIAAEWSGSAAGDEISGTLNILKYCDASWQVHRVRP